MDVLASSIVASDVSGIFITVTMTITGLVTGHLINDFACHFSRRGSLEKQAGRELSFRYPAILCPACEHSQSGWRNIPLLGWLYSWGKCQHCGHKTPVSYPLTEAGCGLLFLLLPFLFTTPLSLLYAATLSCFLIALRSLLLSRFSQLLQMVQLLLNLLLKNTQTKNIC